MFKRLLDNKIRFADNELSLVNYKTESDIFDLERVQSKEEKVES